jgi:predicted ATP-grasp superfamily ATP-dependent carboligase
MLREGDAMAAALAADFLRIPQTAVGVLRDARLPDFPVPGCRQLAISSQIEERQAIEQLSRDADYTVVIAPEINGALTDRVRWVESAGGRLLSPSSEFVSRAADKNTTARLLGEQGVPTPEGTTIRPGDALPADFDYPAVLKPIDGAGSIGVQRIDSASDVFDAEAMGTAARLETYCPGEAVGVAVLCGPSGNLALAPCRQLLSADGQFRYLGSETPLDQHRAQRAQSLAMAAIRCLPPASGYVGVDLVLGDADDGSDDRVIEINPRLTTSYLALRQLLRTNLAAAMLAIARGEQVELCLERSHVRFDIE